MVPRVGRLLVQISVLAMIFHRRISIKIYSFTYESKHDWLTVHATYVRSLRVVPYFKKIANCVYVSWDNFE